MLHNITCIIIDDEENAIELLAVSLARFFNNVSVIARCTTWEHALQVMHSMEADIIFMDISMPGKNGMSLLKLMPNLKSEIIFVTAYEQYAIDAFEFSTAGYVLKPMEDTKFIEAVNRAIDRVLKRKQLEDNKQYAKHQSSKIGIPNHKGVDYVFLSDIVYFESVNRCTKIVLKNGEIVSSYYISRFLPALEGHSFYQVHRSYIVNLSFVLRYESVGTVVMANNKQIPVARTERSNFLKLFTVISKPNGDD